MSAASNQPISHSSNAGLSSPHPSETHQRADEFSGAKMQAERRSLEIGTKANAEKLMVESLFRPINGQTLKRARYDMGKYAHSHIGKKVEVIDGTVALWTERRKDSHGPYWALFCLSVEPVRQAD